MFENIVFMDNRAAIWFTLVMIPIFIFLLFFMRRVLKKNSHLSQKIDKINGRHTDAINVFKNGDECYFISIFTATRIRYYVCFVAYIEALQDFVFCGVCNTKRWKTGDEIGFSPKLGKTYSILVDGDVITLQEKGVRH